MNINVIKFFEKYDADPELQKRVADAVNAYPGSLELREALVEACLLPFAEELGRLPWSISRSTRPRNATQSTRMSSLPRRISPPRMTMRITGLRARAGQTTSRRSAQDSINYDPGSFAGIF